MELWLKIFLTALGAYLVGNVNIARHITSKRNIDISKSGSGNPGTMNMLRTMGIKWAIVTMLFDVVKGALPCLFARLFFEYPGHNSVFGMYIAGISAVIGHMFPVIYGFRGGKSVATGIGVFLVAGWWQMLLVFVVAFAVFVFFKYGSVASFVCIICMTVVEYINLFVFNRGMYPMPYTVAIAVMLGAMLILILFAHRSNIYKLIKGTESSIDLIKMIKDGKAKKAAAAVETAEKGIPAGENVETVPASVEPSDTDTESGRGGGSDSEKEDGNAPSV